MNFCQLFNRSQKPQLLIKRSSGNHSPHYFTFPHYRDSVTKILMLFIVLIFILRPVLDTNLQKYLCAGEQLQVPFRSRYSTAFLRCQNKYQTQEQPPPPHLRFFNAPDILFYFRLYKIKLVLLHDCQGC
jgi:hypothetical protein